jgi:hypothetical protein
MDDHFEKEGDLTPRGEERLRKAPPTPDRS